MLGLRALPDVLGAEPETEDRAGAGGMPKWQIQADLTAKMAADQYH